jgi:hypothetical protein
MDLSRDEVLEETRTHEAEFLGLTVDSARELALQLGVELRLITPESTFLTLDLRPRRITVDVRTGTVTQAHAG